MRLGPDSARYLLAGQGKPVAKPFHLRVLLPWICEDNPRKWQAIWLASWPLLIVLTAIYGTTIGLEPAQGIAAGVLVAALPGVWGPAVVRPVGIDLPAMTIAIGAAVAFNTGWWPLGIVLIIAAALTKETMPIWAALWTWTPLPLIGLAAPLVVHLVRKPEIDEITAHPNLRAVHDHPIKTALEAHRNQWRDAWIMIAPWGICLAALYQPTWPLLACLAVAYAQLFVATDTVRLLHTTAGIPMALGAVATLPTEWLFLAVIAHGFWWRKPPLI